MRLKCFVVNLLTLTTLARGQLLDISTEWPTQTEEQISFGSNAEAVKAALQSQMGPVYAAAGLPADSQVLARSAGELRLVVPSPPPPGSAPPPGSKQAADSGTLLIVGLVLGGLLIVGGGAWYYLKRRNASQLPPEIPFRIAPQPQPPAPVQPPPSAPPQPPPQPYYCPPPPQPPPQPYYYAPPPPPQPYYYAPPPPPQPYYAPPQQPQPQSQSQPAQHFKRVLHVRRHPF